MPNQGRLIRRSGIERERWYLLQVIRLNGNVYLKKRIMGR